MPPLDRHGRPLRSLRISVTDRCNLRCGYCMPEEDYVWLPRSAILSFEEIGALVDAFLAVGVRAIRLTGGEPLLRRGLPELVAMLAVKPLVEDLALTTNALLLEEQADDLRRAGLSRLTVSLDTLRPERFAALTRRPELERALSGLAAAVRAGFEGIKLNAVVLRDQNDDEIEELLAFAREGGHELRFVEYMDVGGATAWSARDVVGRDEILARLEARHGTIEAVPTSPSAPARRFRLADGTRFGIVASTTAPFCGTCDRGRLTADGHWFTCLYAREGLDLARPLRRGATHDELVALLGTRWSARSDRGAEERQRLARREPLAGADELRTAPHLEMHTRGG